MTNNITPRKKNFSNWYQDVITAADMADQAPIRGCVVFKPNGFAIWEALQEILDVKFKESGHRNAYFPVLIPKSYIDKEKDHISGFSPELAVVTYAGGKKLKEPLVVRPTSEAIIGHMFSKWIKSYRDLPLLINQWCNVMRWELRPRVFLRTSEFLWQEGHTAHESETEAEKESIKMLGIYKDFIENDCLIPCYVGKKPEHEKFPGAKTTYTLEALMQDGKALQMGTSHNLGQNFSKAFDIKYLNKKNIQEYVWTTSWGVSTRIIGSLIMVHGDDNGIIVPEKLSPVSIVIIPMYKNSKDIKAYIEYIDKIIKQLSGIFPSWKIKVDTNDNLKPGEKYYYWEKRGVPIRIEIGNRELNKQLVTFVRRDNQTKINANINEIPKTVKQILSDMNNDLYNRALKNRNENTYRVENYQQFKDIIGKKGGFIYAHWDGTIETAKKIQNETKATIRVIPEKLEIESGKCIISGKKSKRRVLFAQAY